MRNRFRTIPFDPGGAPYVIPSTSRAELVLAKKVNTTVGQSRFSLPQFGVSLYEEAATEEERDKVILAFFYYLQACAEEVGTERSELVGKLINTLAYHGYTL